MNTARRWPLLLLAAALCGCFSVQMKPLEINAQASALDIPQGKRLPIKVAVVIPDPMGIRMVRVAPPDLFNPKGKVSDETSIYHGDKGIPMGRELAKLCAQSFPQAFDQAVLLRDLPAPGEYDIVVQASVSQITQSVVVKVLVAEETPSYDWKLTLLDKNNVEFFSTKGKAVAKSFNYSMNPNESMRRMGRAAAEGASVIVKEWVELAYAQAQAPAAQRR